MQADLRDLRSPAAHRPAQRPPWAPWALALLLHVGLLWGWRQATAPPLRPAERAPHAALVWLRPTAVPAPVPPPTPEPERRSETERSALSATSARARRRRDPLPPTLPPRSPQPDIPKPVAPTVAAPSPGLSGIPTSQAGTASSSVAGAAASAPADRTPLLDSAATRAALRRMAREPLLSERAAEATGIGVTTGAERRADAASAAGKGDCVKGEYAGAGMGLFSLPFLAVAAARGQCSGK